jgi:PAS domain S-box-containing protein
MKPGIQIVKLLPPLRGAAYRYGLGIVSVAVALAVGLLARQYGVGHQFAMLLFAVAVAGWNGGLGPAIIAAALSSLAYDYFITEPLYTLGFGKYDLIDLALYLLFAFLISRFREVQWRTEGKLRASEQKYRHLIETSPDAVFVLDKAGKCVLGNAAAAQLYGCTEDELIGLPLVDTCLPTERHLLQERIKRVGDQSFLRFERQFLRKDNQIVPVEVSLAAAGADQYQELVRDITERKRAERQLRKQAELLSLAHDAIIVRDTKGQINFWNQGAEKTYGWTAAEAIGRITHHLLQTRFPVSLEALEAALEDRGEWEGELLHTARDGRKIIVTSRQSLRRREHSASATVMEINRDVTERKRAEEEIRKLNQELEQRVIERTRELQAVNKELEAFAYSVSHDLRAPVRHIAGFTQLLEKHSGQLLDEKSRRYTQMILDSANRMGMLVDDLLAFSRIGRTETHHTTIRLSEIIETVVREIAPDTQSRKITWRIGDLPACHGDPAMLRLVFGNLISNAVKFTQTCEEAEIEIGSLNHTPDEMVVFVKDNGVGFNMKYTDKLFGVFQRLHSQEAFEGTGIGLATVQRIVHGHGGRVWAEGSVNNGATFYVALPKLGKRPQARLQHAANPEEVKSNR